MAHSWEGSTEKAIRMAMARDDYVRDRIALIDGNLTGFRWLVASNNGLFAADLAGHKRIMHGWFFGLARSAEHLFLFQNCGMWNRGEPLGRILRIGIQDVTLGGAEVVIKALDPQCHQIRLIDEVLCVVDTANQCIRRYSVDGEPIDTIAPFPNLSGPDTPGHYRHINSIARVGDGIAIMCHNCGSDTSRKSAVAWLDSEWTLVREEEIDGHDCHDIAIDHDGSVWHSASKEGAIVSNVGHRIEIASGRMTRGLVLSPDAIAVGSIVVAPRSQRRQSGGEIVIVDRRSGQRTHVRLPASPCDIIAI